MKKAITLIASHSRRLPRQMESGDFVTAHCLFDRDSQAMAAWKVRGLPTTFLIDRQGRRAFAATGGREFDDADIVATIKQLPKS